MERVDQSDRSSGDGAEIDYKDFYIDFIRNNMSDKTLRLGLMVMTLDSPAMRKNAASLMLPTIIGENAPKSDRMMKGLQDALEALEMEMTTFIQASRAIIGEKASA